MKALILPLLILTSLPAQANPVCGRLVKIAVIDTGFDVSNGNDLKVKLCKTGHRDFSGVDSFQQSSQTIDPVPVDTNRHGTNVTGLIDRYASKGSSNYCIVIIKWFGPKSYYWNVGKAETDAINYAKELGATIANVSGGGENYDLEEAIAVRKYIDKGGVFVAAAGNEGKSLNRHPYYPAMSDPRVITVGNLLPNNLISPYSNFGLAVKAWEVGTDQEALGIKMTGTSQATAVHTGKMVSNWAKDCSKISKIVKNK